MNVCVCVCLCVMYFYVAAFYIKPITLTFTFFIIMFICVYMYLGGHACHVECTYGAQRTTFGISFFFTSYGFWGLNSGGQV